MKCNKFIIEAKQVIDLFIYTNKIFRTRKENEEPTRLLYQSKKLCWPLNKFARVAFSVSHTFDVTPCNGSKKLKFVGQKSSPKAIQLHEVTQPQFPGSYQQFPNSFLATVAASNSSSFPTTFVYYKHQNKNKNKKKERRINVIN